MSDVETHDSSIVFVVDDDASMRQALQLAIESVGLRVQMFATAEEFLAAYDGNIPACLVLDVRMPDMSGFEVQSELAARGITIPVIMISAYAEVSMAVRAMRAGAIDFIQKPFSPQELLDRVHEALAASRETCRAARECEEILNRFARLTPRQRDVLEGLSAGKPSKIIAAEIGLSTKTVDVHRSRLMQRLGAHSLADLFRMIGVARGEQSPALAPPGRRRRGRAPASA